MAFGCFDLTRVSNAVSSLLHLNRPSNSVLVGVTGACCCLSEIVDGRAFRLKQSRHARSRMAHGSTITQQQTEPDFDLSALAKRLSLGSAYGSQDSEESDWSANGEREKPSESRLRKPTLAHALTDPLLIPSDAVLTGLKISTSNQTDPSHHSQSPFSAPLADS